MVENALVFTNNINKKKVGGEKVLWWLAIVGNMKIAAIFCLKRALLARGPRVLFHIQAATCHLDSSILKCNLFYNSQISR